MTFEVIINGRPSSVRVGPERFEITEGAPESADARIVVDSEMLFQIVKRAVTIADAESDGRLTLSGDRRAARKLLEALAE